MLNFLFLLTCLAITTNAYSFEDILPYHEININRVYKYFELTTAKNFKNTWSDTGDILTFNIEMNINDGKLTIKDTFKARVNINLN
jgi:hypothetical protein